MKIDVTVKELRELVIKQVDNLFGYDGNLEWDLVELALERIEKCFQGINSKYYFKEGEVCFSPFHSMQYSIFLYYLANTNYRGGDAALATKLYYLNKVLHCVDWYYEIELPEVFCAEHPLSSVLGRAKYSDGFFFYQGCTIGGNKGRYPVLGKNVILFANSTVVGDSHIGKNVLISTGALVKDEQIPDNCIVFGQSPNLSIKMKDEAYMMEQISHFFK